MKFLVCLMFFVTAGFTSGQAVQGIPAHSCSSQGPPGTPGTDVCDGKPGQDGHDGMPGRDCPCGTKDAQISELQNKYQELTEQTSALRKDLEQRLSVLEDRIGNTTDARGYPPPTCMGVAERTGIDTQTFYVIDPDGPGRGVGPMAVQCDLQGQTAITLIGHDSEARTHVNGFEDAGSYSKDVTYWNSMEQVRAVVDQSSVCKQLIKYECHHALIWNSPSTPYAWWVTWDGRQADYWGGASPGSGKCACGQTGTCSGDGTCNCDANDHTWREDSGFLSHKDDLPVTQLRFGDTGSSVEEGYHTLGKLICYP